MLGKLDTSLKVLGAVIGALDAVCRHVCQHQVYDATVMFETLVHDRRERSAPSVRHMPVMVSCAIEQIPKCIFACRFMRVPLVRKQERPTASKRT